MLGQQGKCVLCGGLSSTPWGSENGYDAVRCTDCGLVYLSPWPDLSDRARALEFGEHPGQRMLKTNARYRADAIRRYTRVLDDVFGRNYFLDREVHWLDIGCGYGEFIETLARSVATPSTLRGSEPNRIKQESAQRRGLDVRFYELSDLADSYTHISLLNVFSHLPDPAAFLGEAAGKLRAGGEILLQTGNGGDVSRRDFPGMLGFPDHLIFGGRHSLEVLFDRIGMTILSVSEYRVPALTPINVAKDLAKRVLRKDHNPVRWRGPYRDIWVRARLAG